MKLTKIRDFLKRSKIPIDILDTKEYNRVTIRINHNGVSLRDTEIGKKIGTKKQFVLKSGQFILSKIDARYGAFGIAPDEVEGAIITGNFWAYDVDKMKVNIDWFNQFTNSPNFYELCERASSGITHRKYLDESFFLNYEIYLPSVEEQLIQIENIKEQKIKYSKLTNELTHQQDLVKQLRQSFLREAMQGKLVPQNPKDEPADELLKRIIAEKEKLIAENLPAGKAGKLKKGKPLPPIKPEEIPFSIPENWVWCRLGDIAANIEYGTSEKAEMSSEHVPVLRMNNIQDGKIDYVKLKYLKSTIEDLPKLYLKHGDLLFNRTNSYELVGKSGVYHGSNDLMTFASYLIRVQFSKNISTDFINYYINSSFCRTTQLEPEIIQQNGQANFNGTKLKNIICPLPPLHEQHFITNKLERLIQLCDELQQSIQQSKEQNERLLQQVLREALNPKEKEVIA